MGRRRGWGGDTAQRGWTAEAAAESGGADGGEQGGETKDRVRVEPSVRWRDGEMARARDGLNCRWRTKEQRGLWLSKGNHLISAVCCWTLCVFYPLAVSVIVIFMCVIIECSYFPDYMHWLQLRSGLGCCEGEYKII